MSTGRKREAEPRLKPMCRDGWLNGDVPASHLPFIFLRVCIKWIDTVINAVLLALLKLVPALNPALLFQLLVSQGTDHTRSLSSPLPPQTLINHRLAFHLHGPPGPTAPENLTDPPQHIIKQNQMLVSSPHTAPPLSLSICQSQWRNKIQNLQTIYFPTDNK